MLKHRKWRTLLVVTLAALAGAVSALRARRDPAASPLSQRLFLDLPRPFLSRSRLRQMLAPAPGERLLEIGPGTGYYTLDVAEAVAPGGRLDVLDVQQAMLDETMRRARERGISTIVPTRGDAQALPYADAAFDGAFLVATLGETPDRNATLRELRRVLETGARLVVGEGQPDPHMVRLPLLRQQAAAAGFVFERSAGGGLGYVARFRAS